MYSNELVELLTVNFPEIKKTEDGFLDITGQPFKEVVISRIYAYFLDVNKNRQIANLFLDALIELIFEKSGKEIQLDSFVCHTEQITKNKNRIDLVINSEADKKCILIENKIFHHLHNDLLDYWDFRDYKECDKIGVLLTLQKQKPHDNVEGKFINITHKQWMDRISLKGLPPDLTPKEFVYLTDFIKHMKKITETSEMSEEAKFFFDHPGKILRAVKIQDAAFDYIITQLKLVAEKMDWELYGSSDDWRHISDEKNNAKIYYAIEIYKLFEPEPEINIIIEMYKEAIDYKEQYKQALINNTCYSKLGNENRGGPGWLHFVNKWYKLSTTDVRDLSGFILNKINGDFKPVMDVLLNEFNQLNNKTL